MKSSLMRKMKMTTTASLSTPSSNLSDMEKRQIYSNTKECHSLFFLTLVQLHQSLWKLWWLQYQTPKPCAPQLQHCPYSTQGLLTHCHTLTHNVAAAGPPPPHTSTNRHIWQKRAGICARLQREEDQPCDSTNKSKVDCSHYSATQKLVLLNAIFLMPKVKKKKSLL